MKWQRLASKTASKSKWFSVLRLDANPSSSRSWSAFELVPGSPGPRIVGQVTIARGHYRCLVHFYRVHGNGLTRVAVHDEHLTPVGESWTVELNPVAAN
jgi:hypothetical protein